MPHRPKSSWPWTGLLAALLCLAALTTAWELGRLATHARQLAHGLLPGHESAHELSARLDRLRHAEYAQALAGSGAEQRRLEQRMAALRADMAQALDALERGLPRGSADLQHLRAVRTALEAYTQQQERALAAAGSGGAPPARRLVPDSTQRPYDEARTLLETWRADEAQQARERQDRVDAEAERALLGLMGVVGLALLLASGAVAGAAGPVTRVDPERWASF